AICILAASAPGILQRRFPRRAPLHRNRAPDLARSLPQRRARRCDAFANLNCAKPVAPTTAGIAAAGTILPSSSANCDPDDGGGRVKRYIYAFDSAEAARSAVALLRRQGLDDECLSLAARKDIELEEIPARLLDASMDFAPALGRGAALGGITGLFAGIVAMAIPPLGIAVGGPALVGFFTGGALVGTWASALVGS